MKLLSIDKAGSGLGCLLVIMAGQSLLPQERRLFSVQAEWDCELRHASPLLRAGYEDSEKLSNVRLVALLCPPYVLLPVSLVLDM